VLPGGLRDYLAKYVEDIVVFGHINPPYSHSAASMPRRAASGGKRTLSGGTKRCLEGHGFC
jgi:hypothetical protein